MNYTIFVLELLHRFSFRDKHLLVYHTDKLRYEVSITYNALPLQLRSKEKLKTFKSLLYNHFFIHLVNQQSTISNPRCMLFLFCFIILLALV